MFVETKRGNKRRSRVCHWCSYHILTSSFIYNRTNSRHSDADDNVTHGVTMPTSAATFSCFFFFFNLRISCSFMQLYKPSLSSLTYKHGYIFSIEMVCQRKKAEMNKGKSQRGTVWRNLNSKYSCWILRMCEKKSCTLFKFRL